MSGTIWQFIGIGLGVGGAVVNSAALANYGWHGFFRLVNGAEVPGKWVSVALACYAFLALDAYILWVVFT